MHNAEITVVIDEPVSNMFFQMDQTVGSISKCVAQWRSADFVAKQFSNICQKLTKSRCISDSCVSVQPMIQPLKAVLNMICLLAVSTAPL